MSIYALSSEAIDFINNFVVGVILILSIAPLFFYGTKQFTKRLLQFDIAAQLILSIIFIPLFIANSYFFDLEPSKYGYPAGYFPEWVSFAIQFNTIIIVAPIVNIVFLQLTYLIVNKKCVNNLYVFRAVLAVLNSLLYFVVAGLGPIINLGLSIYELRRSRD
jgi:hypothetical protein